VRDQHVFTILKRDGRAIIVPDKVVFGGGADEACFLRCHSYLDALINKNVSNLQSTVLKFFEQVTNDPNHRYRSWEHCFRYFQRFRENPAGFDLDTAALHLGFYLASWGMYRGSTFLFWKDYKIHASAVSALIDSTYRALWDTSAIPHSIDERITLVTELSTAVASSYQQNIQFVRGKRRQVTPTKTQITKTLLGTLGCAPACDRYFKDGFRIAGGKYSEDTGKLLRRVYKFIVENKDELRAVQQTVSERSPIAYPTMKIVDMYFWQIGADLPKNQKALAKGE
jgi:hypothetical protein